MLIELETIAKKAGDIILNYYNIKEIDINDVHQIFEDSLGLYVIITWNL